MEVGLTINEFWQLTWREFLLYKIAYENRQIKDWERARIIAYMIYAANVADNKKSLTSFMPLPSDNLEDEEEQFLTNEELGRTLKMYGIKK